jgi:hypothetical protein
MTARPPRVGDRVAAAGTVRTVEALHPDGHYRITVDVADLNDIAPIEDDG